MDLRGCRVQGCLSVWLVVYLEMATRVMGFHRKQDFGAKALQLATCNVQRNLALISVIQQFIRWVYAEKVN